MVQADVRSPGHGSERQSMIAPREARFGMSELAGG
jgi:hypothetical protein